jgi:hypothetical protein
VLQNLALPLEVSRFLRLRTGILRRGRARRAELRRFPDCDRCGLAAKGRTDPTNGGWYCTPCWRVWEAEQEQRRPGPGQAPTDGALLLAMPPDGAWLAEAVPQARYRAGSWIRSAVNGEWASAGAAVAAQRRQLDAQAAELELGRRRGAELARLHLEREELFEDEARPATPALRYTSL